MPKVSVIIPCYNQGIYVNEAVESVLRQTFQDFEIILINDGSTDEFTRDLLANYSKPHCRVFQTINQGLPAARNFGISCSTGSYLLPLDADDKIEPTYLEKAVKILDRNPEAKIAYCRARYFGDKTAQVKAPKFSMEEMLAHNLIFSSALFRKKNFQTTRGYDPGMKKGWEDWDLWLSLLESGGEVYQIPEILFYYRCRKDSMSALLTPSEKRFLRRRIVSNHEALYRKYLSDLLEKHYQILDSPERKLGQMLLKPLRWLFAAFKPEKQALAEWPKALIEVDRDSRESELEVKKVGVH